MTSKIVAVVKICYCRIRLLEKIYTKCKPTGYTSKQQNYYLFLIKNWIRGGPLTVYSQPEFDVDEPAHYQMQSAKEDSYQDILRNFEWYAQEMHEEAELLLQDGGKGGMNDSSPPRLAIDLPGNYSNFGEFEHQENLFDSMDAEIYPSTDFYNSAPIPQQFLEGLNFEKNTSRPESSPSNTTNEGQFSLGGVQVQ
eukprot:TRINITY_DN9306_c1_g1_i1.p3 TRINITY_DN9306_c1_g1~~TRINITY_DN9306_c1_g1_i1.p3  ORF type:complete len:195 (-),score=26.49 TRINITY_DN9306_c1_g1_i1:306-890(-)